MNSIIILLFILIVLVAAVWFISRPTQIQLVGGADTTTLDGIMDILAPNLNESGPTNLMEHLITYHAIPRSKLSELKKKLNKSELQYKPSGVKLLALIIDHIINTKYIQDPWEFISSSNITYQSFVKPAIKARVAAAQHPWSQKDLTILRELVKDMIREFKSTADPDQIVKQLENHRIYRIHRKQFEPDVLALRPIIQDLIRKPNQDNIDRLIDRIKTLKLLKEYPYIRLDRIYTVQDLLDELRQIKPLDTVSYLEGKRDAERMLATKDKELETKTAKLEQEIKDKELAARLQEEERLRKAAQEHQIREEFDQRLAADPAIQQQITNGEFTREQLFEEFKKIHGAAESEPESKPTLREAILKFIEDVKNKKIKIEN